jgi:oxalate decarboxylase
MNDMIVAQPINGSRGATVAGPRNIPLEAQVPDIFAAPLSDHGSMPNLHFPFAFAHNRLEDGGWAREVTVREMPAMKEACASVRASRASCIGIKRPSGPTSRPVRHG